MNHASVMPATRDQPAPPSDVETLRIVSLLYQINEQGIQLWVEDGSRLKYKLLRVLEDKETWFHQIKTHKSELIQCLLASGVTSDQQRLPWIYRMESLSAPLSYAQQRLFFIDEYEQGSRAYNVPLPLKLSPDVDIDSFEAALQSVVDRHEVLKSQIRKSDTGEAFQEVGEGTLTTTRHALETKDELHRQLQVDTHAPFDLAKDLPLRLSIYTLGEDRYALINFHHIAFDGWSIAILFRELEAFYHLHRESRPHSLRPLPIQYRDFALWQKAQAETHAREQQLAYWRRRLEGLQVVELPTDHPRPQTIHYEGDRYQTRLTPGFSERVRSLANDRKVTLYTLLLGVMNVLLSKYTNESDITLGSITANRHHRDVQDLIGFFVNTLALRNEVDERKPFADFLHSVSQRVGEAQAHQDIPFEHLLLHLDVAREENRNPLFDILFTFQNFESEVQDQGLFHLIDDQYNAAKFDIEFFVGEELDGCLKLDLRYKISLYEKETIEKLADRFQYLLEQVIENPETRLRDLSLLTEEEHRELVYGHNADSLHPRTSLHAMFAQQVQVRPERIALAWENQAMTYRALDEESNQLARHLRHTWHQLHGCPMPVDSLVATYLDRSPEMVVALLAILKAGGAYVPIDPEYPVERVAAIVGDAAPSIALIQGKHRLRLEDAIDREGLDVLSIDLGGTAWRNESTEPLPSAGKPGHLAHVLYTSGTTGRPKGVMVHHEAVVSLVKETNYAEITPDDTYLLISSPVFDATTLEVWSPLLNGAKLVVLKEAKELLADTVGFKTFLNSRGVSHLWLTKTLFDTLFLEDPSLFSSLRYLLTGGETVDANRIRQCLEHPGRPANLRNGYGPTETAVFATIFDCDQPFRGSVPIGRPIHGRKVYILDSRLQPVPRGVLGEIYIGGAGVSRGYLKRPCLTAERFVPNPFPTPEDQEYGYTRLYKSGDLARWQADGKIQFVGRNDFQVKLRGFRIEPGEIESVLSDHPAIHQSAVVVHEHQGHKQLVGYYVTTEPVEESALRIYLHGKLPEYMVPALLMEVDAFQRTLNGKLDPKCLPEPTGASDHYAAPTTELEEQLCSLVGAILGLERVGVDDDFFRIGGDSILSIQLSSRLKKAGFHVAVKDIFRHKTIRRLAAFAVSHGEDRVQSEQGRLEGRLGLLPVQRWFFDQVDSGSLPRPDHWNQSFLIAIPPLDPKRAQVALEALCEHHDMLRAHYRRTEGRYEQHYRPTVKVPKLRRLDAAGCSPNAIEATLTEWQSEFDIFNQDDEALWTAGLIESVGTEKDHYLFFAAHHLVLDTVSWRLLIEDFRTLYEGGTLPAKTTSYRAWVEALERYAATHPDQRRHWHAQLENSGDYPRPVAAVQDHSLNLSPEGTRALLQKAHRAYNTTINDLLLSALSQALHGLTGHRAHTITLEGHGRETIEATLDTTRTVGWFTTLYPVRLEQARDWATLIRKTKEQLAKIPDKGVGYGALGYFADGPRTLPPVSFNYLGVLSGGAPEPWQLANRPAGTPVDPANQDHDLISLTGMVLDGELHFHIRTRLDADASARFSVDFQVALEDLLSHCVEEVSQGRSHHSPSDFHLNISLDLFDRLFDDGTEALYPATSLQQGFLYHALTHTEDDAYRVQALIDFPHPLEVESFQKAWEQAVATYPPLRTSFNWEEEPLQRIHLSGNLAFRFHDQKAQNDIDGFLRTLQQRDRQRAFDLSQPTLLRLHLVACPDGGYTLLLSLHHSIADGWSLPVLLQQVHAFYEALSTGQKLEIPADTAYFEAQRYYAEAAGACRAYWRERMAQQHTANDLNSMLSRPADLETARTVDAPRKLTVTLPTEPLRHATTAQGLTVNTLVQFAWHKLIAIYTGDAQTVAGTTVSGRAIPVEGIAQSVGLYINTLPLLIHWPAEATVLEQLQQIAQRIAEMNTHASEPLASLQKEGRRAFHSLLIYENYPAPAPDPEALLRPVLREAIEKLDYPLSLIVHEADGTLHITFGYDAHRLDDADALTLGERMRRLLEQVPDQLDKPHSELTLLTPEARNTLLYDDNRTDAPYPHTVIHALLEERAETIPEQVALLFEQESLTYQELDEHSNQLARYLVQCYEQNHGAPLPPESRIALYLDRSLEMVVALLAILKAGGAYVPIDPEYPEERVAFLLEDTEASLVLTLTERRRNLERVINLQKIACMAIDLRQAPWRNASAEPLEARAHADNLAYVIYTSGTTGKPKGVMIEHDSLVNRIDWMQANYPIRAEDRILQKTPYSFDVSVWELFWAHRHGAALVMAPPQAHKDPEALCRLIEEHGISILHFVPSMFVSFLDHLESTRRGIPTSLRYVFTSGEALTKQSVDTFHRLLGQGSTQLHNLYGPTETTIDSTFFDCSTPHALVPIGRPAANTRVYILDPRLNPVPQGVLGELYIGGAGVARGYLNRARLCAERFVVNPFATLQDQEKGYTRLYRTGDLVRRLEDGNIEYVGRNDFQVKIRGFRIELGEIEAALDGYPAIRQAVVVVNESQGHKQLVGYYRAEEPVEDSALRAHLQERLPEHMVPAILMAVDAFPLTPNGKLDRKALPQPVVVCKNYVAPTTELEKRLSSRVASLLGLERVGIDDDFFRIGGDSILSIQLSSRLKKAGFHVAIQDIFTHKTIRRLAAFALSHGEGTVKAEQGRLEGSFELLPVQRWFFDQVDSGCLPQAGHWNQSFLIAVPALDPERIQAALETLCEHHDMLRAHYRRTPEGYEQHYRPIVQVPKLRRLDATACSPAEIETLLTEWQSQFDLFNEEGETLWTAGYLENAEDNGAHYLFFAGHHLILDAVSWRLLAEDLRTLYEGGTLPAKSTSYRAWTQALGRYAQSHSDQRGYWRAQLEGSEDYPQPGHAVQNQRLRLPPEKTQALLQKAHQAYHTTINDLLLSALSLALKSLTGHRAHSITLEGHGREAIEASVDIARTVGWFTTLYPVRLEHSETLATLIRTTKEQLASLPDKGVGYGAIGPCADGPKILPPVRFNYLGVLSGDTSQAWQLANRPSGNTVGPANQDHELIGLNGMVLDGELHFHIRTRLEAEASAQFATRFEAALEEVIAHCVDQVEQGRSFHSPSDFHLDISLPLFDRLFSDEIEALFPATSLQQGFLYHALSQDGDDAYRVQALIDYPHPLRVECLREAWEQVVATYPPLRTSFNWEEKPLQRIHRQGNLDFHLHDHTTDKGIDGTIRTLQQIDREQPFDLDKPTLLRIHLVARPDSGYTLLLSLHHSIIDGWSLSVLMQATHALYEALHAGRPLPTNVDTAYLDTQRYSARHAGACQAYWRERMTHARPANDLNPMLSRPTDLEKARKVEVPQKLTFSLPTEFLRQVKAEQGITLNTLVQFAWHKLIAVYTRDTQTLVGTTISGRAIPVEGIAQSVGLYINTLPLLIDWPAEATVLEQLQQITRRIAEMNTHGFEPLASLQTEGRRAFHSLLVYENYPAPTPTPDALLQPVFRESIEKADYPLSLVVHDAADKLHITLEYDAQLLHEADAQILGERLKRLLEQIPDRLAQSHGLLPLLSPEERDALLYEAGGMEQPAPRTTIPALFEQQARTTPDQVALVFEEREFTYRELDEYSNQLAHYLAERHRQAQGRPLPPESPIALYLDRSPEMVIALLAVLKAGGAYVPIDPDSPDERVVFLLEDTQAPWVLTLPERRQSLERVLARCGKGSVAIDLQEASWDRASAAPLNTSPHAEDLAYFIYTSGTTGQPKGVMVEHGGVVNTLTQQVECYDLGPECALYLGVSYAFDASVSNLFAPLLSGARLLLSRELDFTHPLLEQTTHLVVPAPVLETLSPESFERLRTVIFGGDRLQAASIARFAPVDLYAEYGLTEASITSTIGRSTPEQTSIGRPLANTRAYILDPWLNPVPPGVIGEFYIGGAGVARGYLNRPQLTAERFVPHPFPTPEDRDKGYTRLYKTGDLVRRLEDGNIEYVGRNDFQVKIRGFRIELGEIETALGDHPAIHQAVVVVHEKKGRKHLVGYYRAAEPIEDSTLRAHLHERLPEHMVPAILMGVGAFPLTSNGKLDRKALPQPVVTSEPYVAPTTELEEQLGTLVASLLGLERVGVDDDFFRIGGDSILSIQLSSRLKKAGFHVTVQDIFTHKTIRRLATFAVSLDNSGVEAEQGRLEGSFELLPVQRWFFDQVDAGCLPRANHWNQSFLVAVPALDPERIQAALETLCAHHDMLRTHYRRTPSGYEQHYRSTVQVPRLRRLDTTACSPAEIEATLTEWQSGFDLFNEDGEALWTAGYLENTKHNEDHYLFFAAHHLILDAVSWRLLAEDLHTLYEGGNLPAKSTSYRAWTQALGRYAQSHTDQSRYWRTHLEGAGDYPQPEEIWHDHHLHLSPDRTRTLLQEAHQAYHTTINDLLLSALSRALHGLTGHRIHGITLEGHGRETIESGIDTARTVGWFTSLYPVRLEYSETLATLIRATKEGLASLPDKGLGYGALGHFAEGPKTLPPVSFNYLGVLSGGTSEPWQLANRSSGHPVDPANRSHDLISLNGSILDGELHFHVRTRLEAKASARFSADFQIALEEILTHCVEQVERGHSLHSPSDFHLELSLPLFDRLFSDDIEALFPATSLQQGFLYHALTHQGDDAYRVQLLIDYPHPLEVEDLRKAWEHSVATYPPLRTSFNWEEEPLQRIHRRGRLAFHLHDHTASQSLDDDLRELQKRDREQPFDLGEPTLLRLHLVARPDGGYTLLLSMHHSIADGWSLPLLLQEVHTVYEALHAGHLPVPTVDTAYLDAQRYYADHGPACHAYWREQRARMGDANDLNSMLSHPTDLDKARTVEAPRELTITLPSEPLRRTAAERGLTLNTLAQFAWHKLIAIYTGDSQTVVGTTVSGRAIPVEGITQSVGLYINTLPLLVDWPQGATVLDQLQQIARRIAEMNTHAFESLAFLQTEGRRSFHSLLVYENYPTPEPEPDALLQPVLREAIEKVDYPLSLIIQEQSGEVLITLGYDAHRLEESDAQRLGERLHRLLEQVPERLDQPHEALTLLSPEDRNALIYECNRTATASPDTTIPALFEQQARTTPDRVALVVEDRRLTYRELDEQSNRLARYLKTRHHQVHGVPLPTESPIALFLDRSPEMVIALLTILKMGGAYVPIDPEYPEERIAFLLEDTEAPLILTLPERRLTLEQVLEQRGLHRLLIDLRQDPWNQASAEPLRALPSASDLAYVIYTSGTTGQPKGVMIQHGAFADFIVHVDVGLRVPRLLSLTKYTFDIFGLEYALPLTRGGKLVLSSIDGYLEVLAREGDLNLVQQTPSVLQWMLEEPTDVSLGSIRCIVGGEALTPPLRDVLLQRFEQVFNYYGPSETVIWSTSHHCTPSSRASIIGKPLANEKVVVLDPQLNPVPRGVRGELFIAGAGLARGYLNRPKLSAERLIPNLFATAEDLARGHTRLYRTGDLVRRLEDDAIEYLGRNDFQVKIRGFRIELGEIESVLSAHPSLLQATVMVHEHQGNKRLVGYYRSCEPVEQSALRVYLHSRLPEYMVPASLMEVDAFPLTSSGKLDRKALPHPTLEAKQYVAPSNELEQGFCTSMEEVLNLERVGVLDNFFELGGNSVTAIRLAQRLSRIASFQITVADVFAHPTPQSLSTHLASSPAGNSQLVRHLTDRRPLLPTLCAIHPGGAGCEVYQPLANRLRGSANVLGLDNHNMLSDRKIDDLPTLARRYLREFREDGSVDFGQKLHFLGWSMGGLIALEIAALLELEGRTEITVYLLDTLLADSMIQEFRDVISDEEMAELVQEALGEQGHDGAYIQKVLAAYGAEKKIIRATSLSTPLTHSKVVVFKALKPDERIRHEIHDVLNRYLLTLEDNNIRTVARDVTVFPVEHRHDDILESEEIARYVGDSLRASPLLA